MYNMMIIEGRLCSDPEVRTTTNGTRVAKTTIAVDRNYKTGAEKKTDFFRVSAWRGGADFLAKYFHKGDSVLIDGQMISHEYEKDGVKRTAWELQADNIRFVGRVNSNQNDSGTDTAEYDTVKNDDSDLPF